MEASKNVHTILSQDSLKSTVGELLSKANLCDDEAAVLKVTMVAGFPVNATLTLGTTHACPPDEMKGKTYGCEAGQTPPGKLCMQLADKPAITVQKCDKTGLMKAFATAIDTQDSKGLLDLAARTYANSGAPVPPGTPIDNATMSTLVKGFTDQIRALPADQVVPADLTAKLEKLIPGSADVIASLGANRDAAANALDALADKKPAEAKNILSGAGISDAQIQTLTAGMQTLAAKAQANPKQFAQDIAKMFLSPDAAKQVTGFINQAGTFDFNKVVGAIQSGNVKEVLGAIQPQVTPGTSQDIPTNTQQQNGNALAGLLKGSPFAALFSGLTGPAGQLTGSNSPFAGLFSGLNTNGGIFGALSSLFGGTQNTSTANNGLVPGTVYNQDTQCATSLTPVTIYTIPAGTPYPSGCYNMNQQPQTPPQQPAAPRPAQPAAAPGSASAPPPTTPQQTPVSTIIQQPVQTVGGTGGAIIPVATLITQPHQVTRGNPISVSWSSVGMLPTNPCTLFMNSGSATTTLAQGNEGSRTIATDASSPVGTWSVMLQCITLAGTSLFRSDAVKVQ